MSSEFSFIVRFEGTDLNGNATIHQALSNVKGVGHRMSWIVLKTAGINPKDRVGYMKDTDFDRIKEVLADPLGHNIPTWMLNRQKDHRTGEHKHYLGAELFIANKEDIDREKKLRSWRGTRHFLGLKVRGQHTKTTGRSGRTIGVSRKRILAKQRE